MSTQEIRKYSQATNLITRIKYTTMKTNIKLIVLAMAGFALGSCNYNKTSEITPAVKDNVSFQLDIQPIFNQECVMCHKSMMGIKPDLREGFAYKSLMELPEGSIVPGDAEESELMDMLHGGGDNPMPPGSIIKPTHIALIQKWIDEGALDN
jgi:hypothetical protein